MAQRSRFPSRALRAGRRALEGQPGVELLHDWQWSSNVERWFLTLRLTIAQPQGHALPHLPPQTDWCVVVSDYPGSAPEFYPSKAGGITATFPHQSYNGEGRADVPWRSGNLCLHRPLSTLGRVVGNDEPRDADGRLLWRCQRALAWLTATDAGELVLEGEPWELPDMRGLPISEYSFVFAENGDSFTQWQSAPRSGIAELGLWHTAPDRFFARAFLTHKGDEIYKPAWGAKFRHEIEKTGTVCGVWLRLGNVPVVPPYGMPLNWGELREAVAAQGFDLYDLLLSGNPNLRDGRRHLALVGFPIPQTIGGESCRVHWQAIRLPVLSRKTNGFRPLPKSTSLYDRTHMLRSGATLDWIESTNWDAEQLATRGRLSEPLTSHNVLLIGAGALGSAVAELLVRAGVHHLTVIDCDIFQAGNLVRHTLTLNELDTLKASALATRLNLSSPQADVHSIAGPFPPSHEEATCRLREATLVLDCTGDDDLPGEMADFDWKGEKIFASCSLGWGAKRLWLFASQGKTFPVQAFYESITPWIIHEQEEFAEEMSLETAPRESIGCWHPVFPARLDSIWLMAALAVKQLDVLAHTPPPTPQLIVWEQNETGVQRLDESQPTAST